LDGREEWHTDGVTLYPATLIWRNSRRMGVVAGPLIFAFLLLRKAIGWRFRASYGTVRPDRLRLVSIEQVPLEVREQLPLFVEACRDAGFSPCFIWKPAFIGGRQALNVVLLDADARTFATIIWFRISVRGRVAERVVFACHSVTAEGLNFDTGTLPAAERHPELIPADRDLVTVPLETPPSRLIAMHRERLKDRRGFVTFDCESLKAHVLKETQANFDWRCERGFLVPLSPEDAERLRTS
jgi:hypothetical protein